MSLTKLFFDYSQLAFCMMVCFLTFCLSAFLSVPILLSISLSAFWPDYSLTYVSDCLPSSLLVFFSAYSHLAFCTPMLVCFLTWLCAYLMYVSDWSPSSLLVFFSAYSHLAFCTPMLVCFLTWLCAYLMYVSDWSPSSLLVFFYAHSHLAFYKLVCFLTWLYAYLSIWLFALFVCLLFCVFPSCFLYTCLLSDLERLKFHLFL